MTTKRISLQFVLACGFLLLVAGSLSGYVLLSPRRTWDGETVHYIVDNRGLTGVTDSDGGATRVVNAITSNAAWNGAQAGLVTAVKGSVAGFQLGDGNPMLNFTDPQHACNGSCLAATFTGFYSQRSDGTTRIDDADIITNTRQPWVSAGEADGCSGEYFIEGVMVHEVGHGIGLGHTTVTGATMYPSVSACNNDPATTEADDEAAVADLYGGGGGGGGCTLLPPGASCTASGQCCSNKCAGKPGQRTCR